MCNILIIFLFISFLLLKYIWINKLHIICSSFMSKCIYHPVNKSSIRYKNWICYEWMVRLFSFREDTLCPLRVRRRKRDGHVHFITGKFLNQLFGHIFKFCFFLRLVFFSYSNFKCILPFLVYNNYNRMCFSINIEFSNTYPNFG